MSFSSLFKNIKQDLPASIVVFFVAVPLCLGIALASGAPAFSGLIAGIIGGIVVGFLSNSQLGVSGPAAGLAVIVLNAIHDLGTIESLFLAVFLAGFFQVIMGLLKGGVIGYYFPSSVIKGMLSGIGIIIILKQIPHALGYDKDFEGDISFFQSDGENTFSELLNMLNFISPGAILVSCISLAILLLWDKVLVKKSAFFKIVPGPLVAVAFGILYESLSSAYWPSLTIRPEHLVSVPMATNFPEFVGMFSFPDFVQIGNLEVWKIAVTIAIVASLETLLCVEATDKLDPQKRVTNTNRELIAQGVGNSISGLIGGLPITQVIVRSSANIQSGGQTKLSAILHGVLILVSILIIPFILNLIPLAVLASILLVVGYKLAKPALFKRIYQLGWSQFLPFIGTIIGIVFTDLLIGIGIGVAISLVNILLKSYSNAIFLHKKEAQDGSNRIEMTLAEEVSFMNKGTILNALNEIPNDSHLRIDMSKCIHIDYDVLEIIDNFTKVAKGRNIELEIINRGKRKTADY